MALPNSNISVAMVKTELGAATNDVGQLCIHPNINMWSKWKPVRYNSVTPISIQTLEMLECGLYPNGTNTPSEPSFSVTSPHFTYRKPRGKDYNEPYRLSDFTNYNKNAECFIKDNSVGNTLSFNKIFELQSSSTGNTSAGKLYMNKILNTGPNVEITADFLNSTITWESYVGIFFYNVTTGLKFYNAYKVKWSELASSTLSWADFFPTNVSSSIVDGGPEWPEHFYLVGDQMPINDGDVIHSYYCCVPLQFYNSLGQPDQWRTNPQSETYWMDMFNANQVIYFINVGLQNIQVVAPTPTNGHGVINISKFNFMNSNHLSLYNKQAASNLITKELIVNISRNASGVVSCTSARIPLSVYYYSLLAGYDTSLVTPIINIDFEVKANGVTLLREIVSRHVSSSFKEVSGTTPVDGSANLFISTTYRAQLNTTNIPTNETAVITFTMKAKGAGSTPIRTLVSGTCNISTGGVQTWYFDQV
jgi:hypothetical protein